MLPKKNIKNELNARLYQLFALNSKYCVKFLYVTICVANLIQIARIIMPCSAWEKNLQREFFIALLRPRESRSTHYRLREVVHWCEFHNLIFKNPWKKKIASYKKSFHSYSNAIAKCSFICWVYIRPVERKYHLIIDK